MHGGVDRRLAWTGQFRTAQPVCLVGIIRRLDRLQHGLVAIGRGARDRTPPPCRARPSWPRKRRATPRQAAAMPGDVDPSHRRVSWRSVISGNVASRWQAVKCRRGLRATAHRREAISGQLPKSQSLGQVAPAGRRRRAAIREERPIGSGGLSMRTRLTAARGRIGASAILACVSAPGAGRLPDRRVCRQDRRRPRRRPRVAGRPRRSGFHPRLHKLLAARPAKPSIRPTAPPATTTPTRPGRPPKSNWGQ